ncbi:MAG TPA: ankyrin repeat domain-containing protein, partial [bacterium]|nr:ankyrin repeat domain-containing protein [bacterium]
KKTPPTETDLGALLYPGAALDYDALRANLLNGAWTRSTKVYPYNVAAPVDKVVSFYTSKSSTAPTKHDAEYLFTFSTTAALTAVDIHAGADAKTTVIQFAVNAMQATGSAQAGSMQALGDLSVQTRFLDVCKTGTAQDIQAAIKAGAAVNPDKPFMGITPLKQAVAFNPHSDAIMALLKAGADVRAQGGVGDTILAEAANHITDLDLLKALIKAGTDQGGTNPDIQHALIVAANLNPSPAVVELLLAQGADMKAADKYSITPFRAIQPNKKLFGTPVYWKIADASGETLPDMAAYALPDVIQAAIGHGSKVDAKGDKGKTALLVAAEKNPDPGVLQVLLSSGASCKATDADGINALQYAVGISSATGGFSQQLSAAASAVGGMGVAMTTGGFSGRAVTPAGVSIVPTPGIPAKVMALLAAGVPVNVGDTNGMTPLHLAVRGNQSVEVVNALLKAGADVEAKVGALVAQAQPSDQSTQQQSQQG